MKYRFGKNVYKVGFLLFSLQLFLASCIPFVHATDVSVSLLETPVSLSVEPANASIFVGSTQQFTATAHYAGGGTLDVTTDPLTVWSSNASTIAPVDAFGLATGLNAGSASISALYGGETSAGLLNVSVQDDGGSGGGSSGGGGGSGGSGGSGGGDDGDDPGDEPPGDEPPGDEPPGDQPPGDEPPGDQPPGDEPPGDEPPGDQPPGDQPPGDQPPGEEESLPPPPGPPPPGEEGRTPTPETPEFQFISPLVIEEVDHTVLESIFLPDELSVTRGEIIMEMHDRFEISQTYEDILKQCIGDIDGCLSIFLSVTNYDVVYDDSSVLNADRQSSLAEIFLSAAHAQILFDLGGLQLYPDVSPDNDYSYFINVSTLLSIVQGYYDEPDSPFKPYQIITRIEAAKVLLGAAGLMEWIYYPELEATLGGIEGVTSQKTPFADVRPTRDYMWWYPRYVNLGCETGMYDCTSGSNFRPDEFVTEAELMSMLVNLDEYLEDSGYLEEITADDDQDFLKNYVENDVYFTNPLLKDTDDDQLIDSEEVHEYLTSPFLKDSDAEGLTDYDEIMTHKTDPLKIDTDLDNYTDYSEVLAGTDPLDETSFPVDADDNGVVDDWEEKNGIRVENGMQDTDKDGVSDKLEYQFGTNPNLVDSDGDGFTDAEEILQYKSNPLDPNDPGSLEDLGVRITNFQENQLVGDTTPLIKGVAPFGSTVRILLRNDFGHEKVLGSTEVDENNMFLFQVEEPLRDGRYMIVARSLQPEKKRVVESDPVHIIIDSTLNVTAPIPRKLSDAEISDEVLLKNLKVVIRDDKPVLIGETEFGNRVTATWRSVVTSSVLIADAVTGDFEIESPTTMELGEHEVWVTAVRKKDEAQSDTIKVSFSIAAPALGEGLFRGVTEEVAPEIGLPIIGSLVSFVQDQGFFAWIVIAVVLLLIGALGYYIYLSRKS